MRNFLLFTALLSLFACKEKSIYEACCGAEPTTQTVLVQTQVEVGSSGMFIDTIIPAHIFIPNIFMPNNGTGDEAFFMVFGGPEVVEIQSAVFTGENGEIFFSKNSFQVNDVSNSWRGLKPDGSHHYGPFHYEVKIRFIDGQIKTYTGSACAFKCGDHDFPKERLPDCFFPSQNDGYGQGAHLYPYDESCFE